MSRHNMANGYVASVAVVLGVAASSCISTRAVDVGPEPERSARSAAQFEEATLAAPALPAVQSSATASLPAEDSWDFTASMYLWLPSKRGAISSNNIGIPLDDSDEGTGGFLYFEAERSHWGVIANLDLLTTEDKVSGPGGPIEIDEDTVIGELDVTYRPDEESALQFLGGVRIFHSSQDIRFPVLGNQSESLTQYDLILGAQGTWELDERFAFRLRGDIGGFGIDSDLTYQMLGVFGWEFARHWSMTGGYRILGWEFEDDGVRNDIRLSGPTFGVAATF